MNSAKKKSAESQKIFQIAYEYGDLGINMINIPVIMQILTQNRELLMQLYKLFFHSRNFAKLSFFVWKRYTQFENGKKKVTSYIQDWIRCMDTHVELDHV